MKNYQQQLAVLPEAKRIVTHMRYEQASELTHLCNHHFTDCAFTILELDEAEWSGLVFERCEFTHITWKNSGMADCHFIDCRFVHCRFEGSDCTEWISHKCHFEHCEWLRTQSRKLLFQDSQWKNLNIRDSISEHWNAVNLNMDGVHLHGGQACDWNLCRSTLVNCHWQDVLLQRFVTGECQLNAVRLEHICGVAPVWFACHWQGCDLSGLHFIGGSFHRNHFRLCDLNATRFSGTVMCESTLDACLLDAAHFEGIQGQHMRIQSCSLTKSHWAQAHLKHAVFDSCIGENCTFTAPDLRGANLAGLPCSACFTQARLHSAQGVTEHAASVPEPHLDEIARWYANVQPGPTHLRYELIATGASRYV
ncbi:pentapeptide repeat-containing protein (plasmid) [Pantoea dispersa]|uniref:pentapeptide repeat-containing protein n=1 Tax=Pantoea dispersa TaxID=59814 RepID=UPI001CA658DB|nr:pentapeptide repeat-containing protein [Pantoea dispersa]QZY93071.1 pentapeptide repeat-containing protein [Pantoea dispersa]